MDRFVQIQVFYEIAMSIGNSLDLTKMLQRSLSVSLRKLGCFSGAVLRFREDDRPSVRLETVFSIPRRIGPKAVYQAALENLPPDDSGGDPMTRLLTRMPVVGNDSAGNYYHFMELPGFGVLYLAKSGKPLGRRIMKSLVPLNAKLAHACRACIQNELVEKTVAERTMELSRANEVLHGEIAERKKTESALKQAKQAADEASQAKSDFLANMSHEIRTPLNGILGMSELMGDAKMPEGQRKLLGTIVTEAVSLLGIIDDILDFSKIEAGMLELEKRPFDLTRSVAEVVAGLALKAEQKGLALVSRLPADLPVRLVGDRVRLRQILVNLIANALKFTHEGEVAVTVETVHADDRHATLRFRVTDTGIGISAEKLPEIFDSFTQADGSTTRKYGGTGLGTAISKRLVELMGGEIGIESTPGEGSVFWFTVTFPKQGKVAAGTSGKVAAGDGTADGAAGKMAPSSSGAPHREDRPAGPARRGCRILLAEDYPTNQQVALAHLHGAGYRVDLAENGRQAYEAFEKNRYDCVLMDVQMPEMDGYEAARRIRALEKRRGASGNVTVAFRLLDRTPIVALTAHALEENRRKCHEAGMDDFLTKPLRRSDLLAMVSKHLSGGGADAMEPASDSDGPDLCAQAPSVESAGVVLPAAVGDAPIDLDAALEEFLGDREFLNEVLTGFIANVGGQLRVLRRALDDKDERVVSKEAHSIRGGAANLTAGRLAKLASELEALGGSGTLQGGGGLLDRIELEFNVLKKYFEQNFPGNR